MKICFVVQRYGDEVNGGAEVHAKQLAEHVNDLTDHEVEVATTKAIDYVTWKNEYEKDEEIINGIKVHRFPVANERNTEVFNKYSSKMAAGEHTIEEYEEWMRLQGPETPALIEWLRNNRDNYDCFVFMTYLYYTTYFGLKEIGKKAVLIPTAHDEWTVHLPLFEKMFTLPGAFFYNTTEEKELVNTYFSTGNILDNKGIGGVGVEVPSNVDGDAFRKKFNIDGDFMVYIGRIDENKNCPELFKYFREYKNRHPESDLKLALAGKEIVKIPDAPDIIKLGFVSEEDKFNSIAASRFLILPSQFESLSIVVLEAMKLSLPVLVNGRCDVLEAHCLKSNAGLYYTDYLEFEGCIDYLLSHKAECDIMGRNGIEYVNNNYTWEGIVQRLDVIMRDVALKA